MSRVLVAKPKLESAVEQPLRRCARCAGPVKVKKLCQPCAALVAGNSRAWAAGFGA